MFPVIVPHIPFDGHLTANIAIALTGMGVDMGRTLNMQFQSSALFDNMKINELNLEYLSGRITLTQLGAKLEAYMGSLTYPCGFKFSLGYELLAFYRRVFPEMTLICGIEERDSAEENVVDACLELDDPKAPTIDECMRCHDDAVLTLCRATRKIPTLHVPVEQFNTPEHRSRALVRIAEWIGGKKAGGEVGRMVENAQRKLHYVYNEGEKHARDGQRNEASAVTSKDDNRKGKNRAAAKTGSAG